MPRTGEKEREELEAVLVLTLLPAVGDVTLGRLLDGFGGSPRRALAARAKDFADVAGWKAARARRDPELRERARTALSRCRKLGIRVVRRGGPGYPEVMEQIHDPPAVLFFRDARPSWRVRASRWWARAGPPRRAAGWRAASVPPWGGPGRWW